MNADPTSLERYLKSRGAQILGHSINRAGLNIQAGIGSVLLVFGVGLAAATTLTGHPEIVPASIGPLAAGAVNLLVSLGIRRRLTPETPVRVEMSREAKSLLLALYQNVAGWPTSPFGRRGFSRGPRAMRLRRRLDAEGFDGSVPLPTEEVLGLLESAAASYNRIAAVLVANKELPAISKLAPKVTLAADEAMAEVFHHAAALCRYPEGLHAGRIRIEPQIQALGEIAKRLETLATTGDTALQSPIRSSVEDVLAELQLEQLARSELQTPEPERRLRLEE